MRRMSRRVYLIATALFFAGGVAVAGDPYASRVKMGSVTAEQQEDAGNVMVGTVRRVETFERTVTVSDYWGRAMEFKVKDSGDIFRSRDSMDQFATIYDLKPGVQVQVSYTGLPDNPATIRIVILPDDQYF